VILAGVKFGESKHPDTKIIISCFPIQNERIKNNQPCTFTACGGGKCQCRGALALYERAKAKGSFEVAHNDGCIVELVA
jgi:hypothetical protein